MSMNFDIWLRKFAAHELSQVVTPKLRTLNDWEFPQSSVYHYQLADGIEMGPGPDDIYVRKIERAILFQNVTKLSRLEGNPRFSAGLETNIIKAYRASNKRVRPLATLASAVSDTQSLLLINYAPLGKTYRYVKNVFTVYHKWLNSFSTTVDEIVKACEVLPHHAHFLFAGTPTLIPSVSQYESAEKNFVQNDLKFFIGRDAFLSLEFWKWLSSNRQASILAKIPKNHLKKVNIVYQETGKWVCLNLGYLDSFRNPQANDPWAGMESGVAKPDSSLSPEQIQKRYLRFLMTLMQERTVTANTEDEDDKADDARIGQIEKGAPEIKKEDQQADGGDDVGLTPEQVAAKIQAEDAEIDHDLAQLNEILSKNYNKQTESVAEILQAPMSEIEANTIDRCQRLAEDGLLTAKEMARFKKLSTSYKSLPSPYGDGTIEQSIDLSDPELTKLKVQEIIKTPTVHDESMLKSSLTTFDLDYQKKTLNKHTVACVMAAQRAGGAITAYEVDKVENILGAYEVHSVKYVPIEGAPSTWKFKRPVLNDDGTFTSNGTRYRLRKQRIDLPIRKISPKEVLLTSYFGKVKVLRSRKRQHDFGEWLADRVMNDAMTKRNPLITSVSMSDSFDSELKAPRAYTSLSMNYRFIDTPQWRLMFDQEEVLKAVDPAVTNAARSLGNLVISYREDGGYLMLDSHGAVHEVLPDQPVKVLTSLEEFLGIPVHEAPIDFAEVKIYGKEIPVGLILSYYKGLSNLLNILGIQYRREQTGTRTTANLGEWALTFADERLVFSRDDKFACLVLGGFRDYQKILTLYSVYSFDQRGVYLNVLESAKLGVRYLREMGLMNDMFVDPITLEILKKMKEPQKFEGLLLRACELLLSDSHPKEIDPDFMRIRGNERFAGVIYTEIVASLRAHNAQIGKSGKRVEMHPFAIDKRISEDSSKMQCDELNPIQALKEIEAVTYTGEGGRSIRSMTKKTRGYHKNDRDLISEATVDSSMVAINVYTSANPKLEDLSGNAEKRVGTEKSTPGSMLSTSALLAPACDRDD